MGGSDASGVRIAQEDGSSKMIAGLLLLREQRNVVKSLSACWTVRALPTQGTRSFEELLVCHCETQISTEQSVLG